MRLIPVDILCSTHAATLSNYRPHALLGRAWGYVNKPLKLIKRRPHKWRRFPLRLRLCRGCVLSDFTVSSIFCGCMRAVMGRGRGAAEKKHFRVGPLSALAP